jgi:hypothetical protein
VVSRNVILISEIYQVNLIDAYYWCGEWNVEAHLSSDSPTLSMNLNQHDNNVSVGYSYK